MYKKETKGILDVHYLSHSSSSTNSSTVLATPTASKIRWINLDVIFKSKTRSLSSVCYAMPTMAQTSVSPSIISTGGRINNIPMIRRGVEGERGEGKRESVSTGGEERGGGTVQCAARMSPALYADEEGRATMTRDDGRGPGPVRLKPKEIHPLRKGCRGARRSVRRRVGRGGGAACFGSCLTPACLPSSGTSFQTRLCTTRPYINMSSSCRNRADRGEPSPLLSPSLPPPLPASLAKLHVQGSQVERAVVIGRGDVTPPCEDLPLESLLSRGFSRPLPSWAFRLPALDIAGNSSRKFVPGRFIDGIITLRPCARPPVGVVLFAAAGRFVCGESILPERE